MVSQIVPKEFDLLYEIVPHQNNATGFTKCENITDEKIFRGGREVLVDHFPSYKLK